MKILTGVSLYFALLFTFRYKIDSFDKNVILFIRTKENDSLYVCMYAYVYLCVCVCMRVCVISKKLKRIKKSCRLVVCHFIQVDVTEF